MHYGTVLDPIFPPPGECAPMDRACLHRQHYAQRDVSLPYGPPVLPPMTPPVLPPGYCPPNAKCKSPEQERDERKALISTAGVTDQWWFFPAVVVGAWLILKR